MRHGVSNRMGTWWGSFLVFGWISELCYLVVEQGREVLVSLVPSHSKYCLLPKGEKIGPRRPNEPLAGHGASGTNFFDRQGLRASLTQTLKNEELSRAHQKMRQRFTKLSFFLISCTLGSESNLFNPLLSFFPNLFFSL